MRFEKVESTYYITDDEGKIIGDVRQEGTISVLRGFVEQADGTTKPIDGVRFTNVDNAVKWLKKQGVKTDKADPSIPQTPPAGQVV